MDFKNKNEIEQIKRSFGFQTFDISNKIILTKIPEIVFEFKEIVYLDISNNFITEIDDNINSLKNLQYLDIRHVRGLKSISSNIKRITFISCYENSILVPDGCDKIINNKDYEFSSFWVDITQRQKNILKKRTREIFEYGNSKSNMEFSEDLDLNYEDFSRDYLYK